MKTKKVDTWLPVFSGFYGTIWETDNDEEMEIENINDQRKEKGLKPITWDDVKWDYEGYRNGVVKGITTYIGEELKKLKLIADYKCQKLNSPREYNFANDSIDVEFSLTTRNVKTIEKYLSDHLEKFRSYVQERYTSRSGFISSYPNDVTAWIGGNLSDTLQDQHRLGTVFNFILLNEDPDIEMSAYEDLHGNGCFSVAVNYAELIRGTI